MINKKNSIDQIIQQALTPIEPSYECNRNLKKRMADKMRNQEIETRTMRRGKSVKTRHLSGKIIAAAVVCCLMVGTASFAASKVAAYLGGSSRPHEFTSYSQLEEAENKIGYQVKSVEKFSNGYTFQEMSIDHMSAYDEDDNVIGKYLGLDMTYEKAGEDDLYINMAQASNMQEEEGSTPVETEEIEGITVTYCVDTYKWVPEGYERTAEDIANEEKGNYYISEGADEVSENQISYASWEQDGISYSIMNIDNATDADVLFGMAAELIEAE